MTSPHTPSVSNVEHSRVSRLMVNRPDWFAPTAAAGAALAVCAAVALRDPREEGSFAVCPWLFLTGTQCPGCGMLRSLNRVVSGDIEGAAGYNVMIVIAIPVLIYSWFRWALPVKITKFMPAPHKRLAPGFASVIFGILVLFGVLRNLPVEPFTWLHPTK